MLNFFSFLTCCYIQIYSFSVICYWCLNVGCFGQETSKFLEGQNPAKHAALKVHAYALRFLDANRSQGISSQAEAPTTPEKIFDSSTVDMSWDEHLNEVCDKLPYNSG